MKWCILLFSPLKEHAEILMFKTLILSFNNSNQICCTFVTYYIHIIENEKIIAFNYLETFNHHIFLFIKLNKSEKFPRHINLLLLSLTSDWEIRTAHSKQSVTEKKMYLPLFIRKRMSKDNSFYNESLMHSKYVPIYGDILLISSVILPFRDLQKVTKVFHRYCWLLIRMY